VAMADRLLQAGADVNAANEFGATALYAAAAHSDAAMTEKLLAAGADPNVALTSGETALMEAARRGNLPTVRALLSSKADINAKETKGGQNALMWAASQRHTAVVEELVRRGADVNAGAKSGFTPLMFAAQRNDVDTAGILLRAGVDVNHVQSEGQFTPLIIAAAMVNTRMVDLLLDNGAKPDLVDWRGYNALLLVVRDSHYGLDLARKDEIVKVVKSLLAHGADPNFRLHQPKAQTIIEVSLDGATPLLLASEVNNTAAVKVLLDAGADPHATTEYGTTALTLASGAGTDEQRPRPPEERAMAIETAKLLVERGVDVKAGGQFGWTALHAAAYQGLTDVIEFLVSKGADVNEFDAFGQTPLSIALAVLTQDIGQRRPQIPRRYRKDVADLLLKLGATPLDKSGVVAVFQRTGDLEAGRSPTQE